MKAKITQLLAILLVAAIVGPAFAADKEEQNGKEAACPSDVITCGVKLTDDQKAEIKKHAAVHIDKLAKANATTDKAVRKEARKATNKEFRKAVLKLLTHGQKAESNKKKQAADPQKKAKAEEKQKAKAEEKAKGAG